MKRDLIWLIEHDFHPVIGEVDKAQAIVWRARIPWCVHRRNQSQYTPGRLVAYDLECYPKDGQWVARFMRSTAQLGKTSVDGNPECALKALWRKMADHLTVMRQTSKNYPALLFALDAFESWFDDYYIKEWNKESKE